jgi:hypothetical protein
LIDVLLDKGIEDLEAFVELFLGDEKLRWTYRAKGSSQLVVSDIIMGFTLWYHTCTSYHSLHVLYLGKRVRKLGLWVFQRVHAVTEKEVRCCIQCKAEEEIVNADCRARLRTLEQRQQSFEVGFESV